ISKEDVRRALRQVMHPEINHSLVDLGMIKNVIATENKVMLTLMLPFMYIPIKEELIRSVKEAITKLNADVNVEIKIAEMNQEERARFMSMARKAWIR
ncbi:unnamed protein product, partial [marine sediment metagenome]